MEYLDIESIVKILLLILILAYIIYSLKKTSSQIEAAEKKVKLKRCNTVYIIIGFAAGLLLLASGCFFEYIGYKYDDGSMKVWGIEAVISAAAGLAVMTICAIYGRYAWLTPKGIIAPASLEARIKKFRWAIKGDVLKLYKSGSHSFQRYIIVGDTNEAQELLEENFKRFVKRSRKKSSE